MNFTTPALLFPAISLILLAYTNRFLGLSSVIRHLHDEYEERPDAMLAAQIDNLRRRVLMTRNMQIVGVLSMIVCIVSILLLFGGYRMAGVWTFALSLLLLLASMLISVRELMLSGNALNILLSGMEKGSRDQP
ncbi:MAG: DUF2721 domain-containing protein [Neisseria sp.]|nr:DUF2721 domain-containing protein [Neisseria sp.]